MSYERQFQVGWAAVDLNGHMRNSAYLDRCVDVRMSFFSENGFPATEFSRQQIGPVLRREDIEYHRELRLHDELRVTLALDGVSPNGSRFTFRNELFGADGTLAARVTASGGWLDLRTRKLVVPPAALVAAVARLTRTENFQTLDDSVRSS